MMTAPFTTEPVTAQGVVDELRAITRTFTLDTEDDIQAARDNLAAHLRGHGNAMLVKIGQIVIGRRTAAESARHLTTNELVHDEITRRENLPVDRDLIRRSLLQMMSNAPRPGDDYEHLITTLAEAGMVKRITEAADTLAEIARTDIRLSREQRTKG